MTAIGTAVEMTAARQCFFAKPLAQPHKLPNFRKGPMVLQKSQAFNVQIYDGKKTNAMVKRVIQSNS